MIFITGHPSHDDYIIYIKDNTAPDKLQVCFVFLFLWYDRLFAVHILFKFPCKQSKIKVFSFLQTLMEIRRDAVELGISQNV